MELDEKTKNSIIAAVKPVVLSLGTSVLVSVATAGIKKLIVTSRKKSSLTGDTETKPTEDKTVISQVETTAKDTDASLAKDEVKAKDGDLSAAKTDGNALTTEATALESGAAAARTKAGAMDVETKALKMT